VAEPTLAAQEVEDIEANCTGPPLSVDRAARQSVEERVDTVDPGGPQTPSARTKEARYAFPLPFLLCNLTPLKTSPLFLLPPESRTSNGGAAIKAGCWGIATLDLSRATIS